MSTQYQIDKELLKVIKYQLGRKPTNLAGVVKYCPFGKPAVLQTIPYEKEYGVFPTIYWLSCPHLVKQVGKLEDKGIVKDLTRLLTIDKSFQQGMGKAHRDYIRKRLASLDKEKTEVIKSKSPDILKVLKESGVGGIRDKKGIKCLHAHLADYLVNGQNPAGEIVSRMVEWPETCDCKGEE